MGLSTSGAHSIPPAYGSGGGKEGQAAVFAIAGCRLTVQKGGLFEAGATGKRKIPIGWGFSRITMSL
jgi:hypothetical protein